MSWQKSKQCQKQSRNRKISCPACWRTSDIPHFPGLCPPHPSGSWPPFWAFDSARLQHPAAPHWCQLWLLWGWKSQSHTVYCISTCSIRLNIKIWSPSSSFSDSFPVFSGADALVRQKKMKLPSLASRVSSMDTNMLNTIKTRQMQKWVPAAQTDRGSVVQAVTAAVCWVCVCVQTADWRMMGLQWLSPGIASLRMTRNMVKLSTSVTLKELRSPPPSGRPKLITSAETIRIVGSSKVMKGLRYLILSATWQTEFHHTWIKIRNWNYCLQYLLTSRGNS